MHLSNTSKYTIRILANMVNHKDTTLISAKELSDNLKIPYKFLTKIMTELVRVGFIESIRGREGGYKFLRPASEITVGDILELFNDSIKDEECILGIDSCNAKQKCALHDKWIKSKIQLQKMFKESTIESIAAEGNKI
ncbi:Rrf2 family transcriptional regulator [Sulfurovum sp.]|uniref:RrF2 family transcriptional regulator n=1 Tax=Sulfurovum sp. TaxID=1969726 RepID=UPI0028680733|nr:Rrf2 family transcriptional regulator [Sulfurovum sp.]